MALRRAGVVFGLGVCALLALAGCNKSSLEAPEVQGPAAMVDDAGKHRLWLLTKQEERRQKSVGGRRNASWRTDTFFHFAVEAIDPATTKTLWKQRLVTYGDPKASGSAPSRIIGSSVDARLLGQDGATVWLLVGDAPYAVSAADGHVLADPAKLQEINPTLKGLLPSEARHYGFDQGLVLMSADARQFVVRGAELKAAEYTPPPPPVAEQGPVRANGTREMVPMRPLGEFNVRHVQLGERYLGLYSPKEREDVLDDEWGRNLRWPYSVLDEGALARRSFWVARKESFKRFDDQYERIADLSPVAGSPTFLKGRLFRDPANHDEALQLEGPKGLLVWHSTRMDDAGRLALARVDDSMKTVWRAELPLSETDFVRRIATWVEPGRVLVVGMLQAQDDGGVMRRDEYLVSVDLATGAVVSRKLNE